MPAETSPSPSQRPTRHPRHERKGFALIITITLLAFLVLLLVSLASMTRVETQVATNTRELAQARQNALYGLQIAIGQLQKYAGADQRITAPATTIFPSDSATNINKFKDVTKGTGELYDGGSALGAGNGYKNFANTARSRSYIGNNASTYLSTAERAQWDAALANYWNSNGRNPHYVGVIDASLRVDRASNPTGTPVALSTQAYEADPNTLYGEPKRDQIPVWLVSGVEKYNIDQLAGTVEDAGGTDKLSEYISTYSPTANLPPPLPTNDTIYLVNTKSATLAADSVDGIDGRVKVRKQPIIANGQTLGAYAYWVGDESLKANFAVQDPYAGADRNGSTSERIQYRNRLQSPQRLGWERITGFTSMTFDPNDTSDPLYTLFTRVLDTRQIQLLDSSLADEPTGTRGPLPRTFHHLTGFSTSLLTDVHLGGLKQDLTYYLKRGNGNGLNDDDPIPTRTRYDQNDPRFKAWGATNTGFPVATPPYRITGSTTINAIPTWGQLRTWYNTQSPGGSAPVAPTAETAPVLTYLMLHSGWSYDPTSKRVRWHWLPCVVLWNPYDVGLNSATYDLEVGINPATWNGLIVKEEPTLGELQQDTQANWQEIVTTAAGEVLAPTTPPRPILEAYKDTSATPITTRVRNFTATGPGQTIRIFKAHPLTAFGVDAVPGRLAGETNEHLSNRYFVQLPRSSADTIDMNRGPWTDQTNESTLLNGVTDIYGRFFYRGVGVHPTRSRVTSHATGNTNRSSTGPHSIALRINPFTVKNIEGADPSRPVEFPLKFQITTEFAAGQAKVFTVGNDVEWNHSNSIPLVNDFNPTDPSSLWFDIVELRNGPATAASTPPNTSAPTVRFQFNQLAQSQTAPTVRLRLGTDDILRVDNGLGSVAYNNMMGVIRGKSYGDRISSGAPDPDGDLRANGDDNVEPPPKFVNHWRALYNSSDFKPRMSSTATDTTESSIWSYGATWVQPLTSNGSGSQDQVNERIPIFSRFNFAAKVMDTHPLERRRDRFNPNNTWGPGTTSTRLEGLTRMYYVRSNEGLNKWDDDQANGSDGYALIVPKSISSIDGANILGLSVLPIRNSRRVNSEVLSLGQFQQVNLSGYFWQSSFPIGNSFAPPYTDREAIAGINSRVMGGSENAMVGRVPNATENNTVDISYLLNESLWDRYFLSTIPQTGSIDTSTPLPNSRLRFNAEADTATSLNFDTAAATLHNIGALNVNSTSVEAWRSLLTAFRKLKLGSTGQENPDDTMPISRTLDPIQSPVDFTHPIPTSTSDQATFGLTTVTTPEGTGKSYSNVVGGFRYLNDAMIDSLARRIVDEVRLRGPFLSVSDFVNRRLVAPAGSGVMGTDGTLAGGASAWYDARTNGYVGSEGGSASSGVASRYPPRTASDNQSDYMDPSYDPFPGLQGLSGTLQRAIQLSGINGGVNYPYPTTTSSVANDRIYSIRIKNTGGADYGNHHTSTVTAIPNNAAPKHTQEPAIRSHLDTEHIAGAPVGEAGQIFDGTPAFITQGDLLAMIGPALTARGDTFVIRTYGDAINPATGELQGRAWLEAIVQRTVDPVTPQGTTGANKYQPTTSFGRKFKVVSFRWLGESDL